MIGVVGWSGVLCGWSVVVVAWRAVEWSSGVQILGAVQCSEQ